eukprot:TRINITY_DN49049_c0_g1_i1.p1 TRINITY_DN49049_c0_g1~~TRINITY_DN49049_c0_g1_i1.p1  ORF type:complete len:448 (-),score=137.19 TRINITY_DN49049_c0_g1_i1:97-1440(-)
MMKLFFVTFAVGAAAEKTLRSSNAVQQQLEGSASAESSVEAMRHRNLALMKDGSFAGAQLYMLDLIQKAGESASHNDGSDERSQIEAAQDLTGVEMSLIGLMLRNSSDNEIFATHMRAMVGDLQTIIPSRVKALQTGIDRSMASFATCESDLEDSIKAARAELNQNQVVRHLAHHDCRVSQNDLQMVADKCSQGKEAMPVLAAQADEAAQCSNWPSMKMSKSDSLMDDCSQIKAGESYESYLERVAAEFDEKLKQYRMMQASCSNAPVAPATPAAPAAGAVVAPPQGDCLKEKDAALVMQKRCNQLQLDFEATMCGYANKVTQTWLAYGQCYQMAQDQFVSQKMHVAASIKSQHDELVASKRIDCLLDGLKGKTEEQKSSLVADCQTKVFTTPEINVNIPKTPARKIAETLSPEDIPGNPAFAEKKYKGLVGILPSKLSLRCPLAGK